MIIISFYFFNQQESYLMIDILKLVTDISVLHSCSINILFIVISYPLPSIAFNYAQLFGLQFTSSRTRPNLFLYHDEVDHYISYCHIIYT